MYTVSYPALAEVQLTTIRSAYIDTLVVALAHSTPVVAFGLQISASKVGGSFRSKDIISVAEPF